MSPHISVIHWLHYKFSSTNDSNLKVGSKEIKIHLGKLFEDINHMNLAYYMKHAFPSAVSKSERMEDNWAKKHVAYLGVKRQGAPIDVSFIDIPTQLPHDFFVLEKSEEEFVFGKDSGLISLGNRILIETTVNVNFDVNVKIQGKKIDNAYIGLMSQIHMDSNCIDAMFCTIRNIKLCKNSEITYDNFSLKELSKCLFVLPIQARQFSTCKNCRARSRRAKSDPVCINVKSLIKSSNQVKETRKPEIKLEYLEFNCIDFLPTVSPISYVCFI